jgi:hypothetical protein
MLHQVGDLYELNVKLWCQKVNITKGCERFQQISSCMSYRSENRQWLFRVTAFSIDVYNGESLLGRHSVYEIGASGG